MGKKWEPKTKEPEPAKAFLLFSYDEPDPFFAARKDAESLLGKSDYETKEVSPLKGMPPISGEPDRRKFTRVLSYARPIGRDELVVLKQKTLSIEASRLSAGKRLVELDIGYVTSYQVVHASLTDSSQSVYLYGGVYGEIIYRYDRFTFKSLDHAASLFHTPDLITAFNDIRLILDAVQPKGISKK